MFLLQNPIQDTTLWLVYLTSFFFILSAAMKLFLFIYFYLNWRLITLQYCGGFCHSLKLLLAEIVSQTLLAFNDLDNFEE